MQYRGIISDFDGTIAISEKISDKVGKAIRDTIQRGYVFTIATGRPYEGAMKRVADSLGITAPLILHGGSKIVDPTNDHVLWEEPMSDESANKIIEILLNRNLPIAIEMDEDVYTNEKERSIQIYGDALKLYGLIKAKYTHVYKILMYGSIARLDEQRMQELKKEIQENVQDVFVVTTKVADGYGFDLTSFRGTKQTAVAKWCSIMNIDHTQIIGIGDGGNDYPLLSACGLKIAMGNAGSELKELADFIAPPVEKDGLATVLQTFF